MKRNGNKAAFVSSILPLEKCLNFLSTIAKLKDAYGRIHHFTLTPATSPFATVCLEKASLFIL